jgi:transcriptional regulator with PAS, ATPase and Fis domain
MIDLREYIRKVARSDVNVLITGETGTGKERVAESIHNERARRDLPFICINCAAIPDTLIESELFGFERGAFTGAREGYPGKFRLAGEGTVFLDEIGDMSLSAQAKVLRVIETRQVFPLGARHVVSINARFIAAINQDLELLIAENKFRRDLYYRLNVARILLLPLNERKEDIPELLTHYLNQFNQRYSCHVERPTEELLRCLLNYTWPGNIRELRNFVEAVFIDPPSGRLSLENLPQSFRQIFGRYIQDCVPERERLISALSQTNWNKSQAAGLLNWSRMSIYRKLAKYKINDPSSRDPDQ